MYDNVIFSSGIIGNSCQRNATENENDVGLRISPSIKRKGLLPPIEKTDKFFIKQDLSDVAIKMNYAYKATKTWVKGKAIPSV